MMTESVPNKDVQSMDIDDLSEFLESKDIDIEDTLELASKLLSSLHCHVWCALFKNFHPLLPWESLLLGVVWADLIWIILEGTGP